jgi:hypothetical protein
VIRGISDLLVDRGRADRGERQRVAARTAAAFAVELLGRLAPRSPSPSRAEQAADPGTVGRPQRHRQPDRRIKAVIYNEQQVGNNVINYGTQAASDDR